MSRRGLGRGLGALLAEDERQSAGVSEIPTARVFPNPQQPRQTFQPEALDDLQRSITELGVLVPVIVRPKGDAYELIAGERRWRAATAAGLATIPAIVRQADDRESLELAIVENLQREDLDPLEEAMGFFHLMESFSFTQERVAERIGRSRPAVANALRLLGLPDTIKAHIRSRRLTPGHARALLALPEDERERVAERVVRSGGTVRSIEAMAREKRPPRRRTARANSPNDDVVVDRLRYRLGAPVEMRTRGAGGTIEVRYADGADLARIVEILLPDGA